MNLEQHLILRYLKSYIVCFLMIGLGTQFVVAMPLSLFQKLHLSTGISLGWQVAWVTTSGLARTLHILGWRTRRALMTLGISALSMSCLITFMMVFQAPVDIQTLDLKFGDQFGDQSEPSSMKLCVWNDDDVLSKYCQESPWKINEELKHQILSTSPSSPSHFNSVTISIEGWPQTQIFFDHPQHSRTQQHQAGLKLTRQNDTRLTLISFGVIRVVWLILLTIGLGFGLSPRISLLLVITINLIIEMTIAV